MQHVSSGSYFAVQMAAAAGGAFKACVAAFVAHEPGLCTLWDAAPPTFKNRFMMMAGYEDKAAFDAEVAPRFDLRPWAARLACPLLAQAGEDDELSPLEHTEELLGHVRAPKRLAVYEGAKHVLRGGAATVLGENPDTMFADWILDRFAGRPMASEQWFITQTGQTRVAPLEQRRGDPVHA